jgi:class 3 adenylate cyclase
VVGARDPVALTELFEQPRRALDVGEEEGNRPMRELGHSALESRTGQRSCLDLSGGAPYAPAVNRCANCGHENADAARFCSSCGEALSGGSPPSEVRKTVTIIFTDLVASTSLGERLDPETVRRVMWRYFNAMQAAIEYHGGTVEKFIGDAIMAVFGLPTLHEDDALRAVRAAVEMRMALAQLNEELDREPGIRIATRTGVNTGEVIAGDAAAAQKLATGDAVNVAARLEQAADAGEILIGAETHRWSRTPSKRSRWSRSRSPARAIGSRPGEWAASAMRSHAHSPRPSSDGSRS